MIDAKVYNLSRFKDLHPGGIAVLLDGEVGPSSLDLNTRSLILMLALQPVKMPQKHFMASIVMKYWSVLSTNAFRSVQYRDRRASCTTARSEKLAKSHMPSPLG